MADRDIKRAVDKDLDKLAKGLATGNVSRSQMLKYMGGAFVGGILALIPGIAVAQSDQSRVPAGVTPGLCPEGQFRCGPSCCPNSMICQRGECVCPGGRAPCGGTCCAEGQICGSEIYGPTIQFCVVPCGSPPVGSCAPGEQCCPHPTAGPGYFLCRPATEPCPTA